MGADLIYPIVNLFQYSLREGLDDSEAKQLERARVFYSKFTNHLSDAELQTYRDREQVDREFNAELIDRDKRSIRKPLDGSRNAIQLSDTYALHLNFSGQLDDRGKPDTRHQDPDTAFNTLKKIAEAEKLVPSVTKSFGRTWLLIAFIDNPQVDKLSIAKSCYEQIHGKQPPDISVKQGHWHGGEIFEFWTPPLSYQPELTDLIEAHPHVIVWLFPIDSIDRIQNIDAVIAKTYPHWIKLLHYRHKIFSAYHKSQNTVENRLKNSGIRNIAEKLNSNGRSLHQLQNILLDSLDKFQTHSSCIQFLEDQQHTIEINRDNYRFRCEDMTQADPHSNLQFLLEFETKHGHKYQRQITADLAYLDSSLKAIENLSQTIQSTVQIERAKSDRTTNVTIAAVGAGLATSQVVCAIVLTQTRQERIKDLEFYNTNAFEKSWTYGSIPIFILVIYLVWVKLQSHKSAKP
jgi:hypothetical protein